MQIDVRVMELLASKMCHDLVSPVSAINNGVELIEDIGGSVVDEAMKLISDSGMKAARRLRCYRLAYGRAGSEGSLTIRDVRQVAEQYLSDGKISLVWADDGMDDALSDHRGFLKVLLNMIILAEETLAYGGVIAIRKKTGSEEGVGGCRVEIVGRNATLNLRMQEAVDGAVNIDDLTPRTIQAYVTGRFAEQFCFRLLYDLSIPDRLDLVLEVKEAVLQPQTEVCGMQSVKVC